MNYWIVLQKKIPQTMIWIVCLLILPKGLIFFLPFVIGAAVAAAAAKPVRFIQTTLHLPRKGSTAVVLVMMTGGVLLAIYLVGSRLWRQGMLWLEELPIDLGRVRVPVWAEPLWNQIRGRMDEILSILLQKSSITIMNGISGLAKQFPKILMDTGICLLSAYYFAAADQNSLRSCLQKLPRPVREQLTIAGKAFRDSLGCFLWAQLKIEGVILALLWAGLVCLGIPFAIPIALVIAVMDLLPLFGTGTILLPWAGIRALQGRYMSAVGLLSLWLLTQVVRQAIQPGILGRDVQLSPLTTLVLFYVGFRLDGVRGMLLAVPMGTFIRNLVEAQRTKPV